jgi:hypothetical protein
MIMALVGCLLAAATPATAEVIPDEWVGIWEIELTTYDCTTNDVLFATTQLDTICPGAVFEDPNTEGIPIVCTTTADADSYTTHCEGSTEVVPGCTANFVYDVTGTRNGDSYTATSTVNLTYTGDCFGIPDSCQRTEISGTRIAGAPSPCDGAPVENQSWGTVKSIYR